MLTYTPADSMSDGPVTNLLSVLWILTEVLSRAHAQGTGRGGGRGEPLNNLKFGSFIGRFSNDDAASVVK